MAVTIYVNAAGSGTSPYDTEAKGATTVAAAITYAKTVDPDAITIYVKQATYTPASISINDFENGTVLTIEGYKTTPGDGSTDANRPTLNSSGIAEAIWSNTSNTWVSGSLTLKHLIINAAAPAADYSMIKMFNTNNQTSLVIDHCALSIPNASSGNTSGFVSASAVTEPTRTLTVTDSTLTSTQGGVVATNGWATVTIEGSSITSAATSAGSTMVSMSGAATALTVTDSTLTGYALITCASATALDRLVITDSILTSTVGAVIAHKYADLVLINRNTFNAAYSATRYDYLIGIGSTTENPSSEDAVTRLEMINNTLAETGTAPAGVHIAFVGFGTRGIVSGNMFASASAAYGIVFKGDGCVVRQNVFAGAVGMYIVGGQNNLVTGNTCRSTVAASGNTAFSMAVTSVGDGRLPTGNTIYNNIIDGGAGQYAMTFPLSNSVYILASDCQNRFDHNLYVAGSVGMALMPVEADDAEKLCADLTAVRARWAAIGADAPTPYTTVFSDNDEHSTETDDAGYISTAVGNSRYLALRSSSPAKPTLARRWNPIGAWGRKGAGSVFVFD